MSGVKIVRALLVADAALIVQVPATKIIAGVIKAGTQAPAIAITEVVGIDRNIPNPGVTRHVFERVQVTLIAKDYAQQKAVMKLLRKACADKRGTIAGIAAVTVVTEGRGPDFNDEQAGFYMQSQDFRVGYQEAT